MNEQKLTEVFISRIVVDWQDNRWVWYPTVQQSLLVIDNGKVRVVKGRDNYHTATRYVGSCFDNYEQAFLDAVEKLKKYKEEDFSITESNFERQFGELEEWKERFDNVQPRKIVFEDLGDQ